MPLNKGKSDVRHHWLLKRPEAKDRLHLKMGQMRPRMDV